MTFPKSKTIASKLKVDIEPMVDIQSSTPARWYSLCIFFM